jgi:hypothetical protein
MEFPILPELVGSEKQVLWATSLRAAVVADMRSHRAEVEAWAAEFARDAAALRQVDREAELFALILSHAAASWWIDRRELSLLELTRDEAAAVGARPAETPRRERGHGGRAGPSRGRLQAAAEGALDALSEPRKVRTAQAGKLPFCAPPHLRGYRISGPISALARSALQTAANRLRFDEHTGIRPFFGG